jgi:5-methyltetrahydrofolate--homocysteine methyltransferase
MIAHPMSRYFGIGEISSDQFRDYAVRRGLPAEDIKRFLARNIMEA